MLSDKQGPTEGLEGATCSVCNTHWCVRTLFSSGFSVLPLLFANTGWMYQKMFCTVTLGEGWIRHLSLLLADFLQPCPRYRMERKKGSALMIQQGNKLLGFQRWWTPPFRSFSFGQTLWATWALTACKHWLHKAAEGACNSHFRSEMNKFTFPGEKTSKVGMTKQFSFKVGEFWQPSSPHQSLYTTSPFGGTHKDKTGLSQLTGDQGDKPKCSQPSSGAFRSENVASPSVAFLGNEGCRKRLWRVLHKQWALVSLSHFLVPAVPGSRPGVPAHAVSPKARLHRGTHCLCSGTGARRK